MHQTTGGNNTVAIGIVAAFIAITAAAWAISGGTATAGTATGAEATLLGVTPLVYVLGAGILAGAAIYAIWPALEPDGR